MDTAGPCETGHVTVGPYGDSYHMWIVVMPTVFSSRGGASLPQSYHYACWFTGLEPAVEAERATWSAVKALYD